MNLSQRNLRMFVTTAAFGHVTRASAALHITQPALTRALRDFEAQVGVQLFDRSTRRLQLTPPGRAFLPVAQRMLQDMERAVASLRAGAEQVAPLVIGTGAAFGATLLPAALAALARSHPSVPVRVVTGTSGHLAAQVATGDIDVAIASPVGDLASLRCEPVLSAAIGIAWPAGAGALGKSISLARLAELRVLKDASDSSIAQLIKVHGPQLVAGLGHGIEVSDLSVQLALAASGAGVALISALAAMHPQAAALSFIPLRPALRREWCVISSRSARPSSAIEAFAGAVRHACGGARLHPMVRRVRG